MPGPRASETDPFDAARAADASAWLDPAAIAERQTRLEDAAKVARRLAHDFGNVLTGILGFSELSLPLLRPDSPVYQYTAEVQRAAQQGAELTQRLRWFSRRGPAEREASSLAEAVSHEEVRLRSECGRTVRLSFSSLAALPPVALDGEPLRQVFRQLFDNAREALESGGTISLSARETQLSAVECSRLLGDARPGVCIEVTVSDDGCGLTSDARQRLFVEPFYSSKPRHRGLGLAIVYGILRNSQSGFRLDDGPDGGTVVRLYLPVAVAPIAHPAWPSPARTVRERILVVDDDPGVLHLVRTTLERAGYRVEAAGGGAEALECYTAAGPRAFELVLSDVVMPRVNGVDLARGLLSHDAHANVLFMSGQLSPDFDQSDILRGKFAVLAKPFWPEGLLRAVRNALDQSSTRVSSAGGSGPLPQPTSR